MKFLILFLPLLLGSVNNPESFITSAIREVVSGNYFQASSGSTSTGSVGETAYFYLKNDVANTKTVVISKFVLSGANSTGGITTYKFYMNPTVTVNGTAVTISGARQAGQNTASAAAYKLPTVSANGTLFSSVLVPYSTPAEVQKDFVRWIEPGNSLLVTSTQSVFGGNSGVDVEFIEK